MSSKTRTFVLPIVGAMSSAFLLHSCGPRQPRQICVDASDTRVADANCLQPNARYHWYYYPRGGGGGAAGIGFHAYGGSAMRASGVTYFEAPSEGVTRGGFGGIGGSGDGGGGE